MKNENDAVSLKFYYPICNVKDCGGILFLRQNPNDATINYECENDYLHKGANIKNDDFLKHYIKEQNYANSLIKCNKHDNNLSCYCNYCKKYLCDICSDNCYNKNHPITYIDKYILSEKQINHLRKSFEEKKAYNKKLILLLDEWQKELIQKLDDIKYYLKNEIKLIEKLIINYNKNFNNLVYQKNIMNLKDKINNNILNNFYNSNDFLVKFNDIFEFCKSFNNNNKNIYEIKTLKHIEKSIGYIDYFLQINNNNFLGIESNGSVCLYNYNKYDGLNLRYKLKDWKFKEYKANLSIDKTQIFMNSQKKIRILNLDISSYTIEPSLDKINYDFKNSDINDIIELRKGIIAIDIAFGSKYIIFTKKNNEYYNKEIITNDYSEFPAISFFNNEEFIISECSGIKFYDIDSCECNKHISVNLSEIQKNKINLFGDYILCFGRNGCGGSCFYCLLNLIYVKTKELVQIFEIKEKLSDYQDINIFIENNEIIHLFCSSLYYDEPEQIVQLKMIDGTLEYFDEITNKKIYGDKVFKKVNYLGYGFFKSMYFMDGNEVLFYSDYHLGIHK